MEYVNCYEDICNTLSGRTLLFATKRRLWKELFEYRATLLAFCSLHKKEGRKTNNVERKNYN